MRQLEIVLVPMPLIAQLAKHSKMLLHSLKHHKTLVKHWKTHVKHREQLVKCCWQGALSVQKIEKITRNSTHSQIQFYIIFIKIFFLGWILKYVQMGREVGGRLGVDGFFFYILLY